MIAIYRAQIAALGNWEATSETIAKATDEEAAISDLMSLLNTTPVAASAVLDIQIRRLMGSERVRMNELLQELIEVSEADQAEHGSPSPE